GKGGVDLRTAQELAGHSTPTLTARYAHRRLYDLAGAVEKLPAFLPGAGRADSQPLAATGTDGESATRDVSSLRPACAVGDAGCDSARGNEKSKPVDDQERPRAHLLILTRDDGGCEGVREDERERPLPDSNRGMADLQSAALPLG